MTEPVLNITMPVFNRFESTQRALLALKRTSQDVPFTVTVVDNGSEPELVSRLREFKRAGIIDKLFLLDKNYGISCACNIGWKATSARFYMKLDNDIIMQLPDWPERLFRLWSHGEPLSTLGATVSESRLLGHEDTRHTEDGILGVCTTNLAGYAMIVPKTVSDIIGYWNEDYGLYGAEDGDYGLRMNAVGFPQYYYFGTDYLINIGQEDVSEVYDGRLDRDKEYRTLFVDGQGGAGLFPLNNYLYNMCIRAWNVPSRYEVADVSEDFRVKVVERKEYEPVKLALEKTKELVDKLRPLNACAIYEAEFVLQLKELWTSIGQGCGGVFQPKDGHAVLENS